MPTFTEIVAQTAERLNLTSAEALARLGRYVNDRNRQVTSSVGLNTSRRATNSQNTVIGITMKLPAAGVPTRLNVDDAPLLVPSSPGSVDAVRAKVMGSPPGCLRQRRHPRS